MKYLQAFVLVVVVVGLSISPYAKSVDHLQFGEEQADTLQKAVMFSNPAGAKHVNVDNVNGYVHVVGYDGTAVQLVAHRTIRAASKEEIELAKKEVELKITEKNNTVEFYVDGPFRCQGRTSREDSRRNRYNVNYDIDLQVPRDSGLYLRTINHGDIQVERVDGDYDVKNINGKVQLTDIAGAGHAYSLNGGVRVEFSKNPPRNSYFGTLNGNVDVAFQRGLSADLRFKTFNGSAYSSFAVTPVALESGSGEHRNGKFIYRSNRSSGARVGSGGPELQFDTFNGNIHLTER
ncbi:MAG: hypothetical protein PHX83_01355 [Acidobacteriia bacterium]|nr:hypothetical protein [Terriglobia bacterium]